MASKQGYIVYRNYLIPDVPKTIHTLASFLKTESSINHSYEPGSLRVAAKAINADQFRQKQFKQKIDEHNEQVRKKQKNYSSRYLKPLNTIPTFEQMLISYTLDNRSSPDNKPPTANRQHNLTNQQKQSAIKRQILYQIEKISPKVRYQLWMNYEQIHWKFGENHRYLKQVRLPSICLFTVYEVESVHRSEITVADQHYLQRLQKSQLPQPKTAKTTYFSVPFHEQIQYKVENLSGQPQQYQAVLVEFQKYYQQRMNHLISSTSLTRDNILHLSHRQYDTTKKLTNYLN